MLTVLRPTGGGKVRAVHVFAATERPPGAAHRRRRAPRASLVEARVVAPSEAARRGHRVELPKVLRTERRDLLLALHDKPQGGRLAGTVREEPKRRQAKGLARRVAQRPRQQPRERDAHFEVELLPRVDGRGLRRVWVAEARHRAAHLALGDGGEFGAAHALRGVEAQDGEHLVANVLALAIAIEPQAEPSTALGGGLQVTCDAELLAGFFDHLARPCVENGRDVAALLRTAIKVQRVDVAHHARDGDGALALGRGVVMMQHVRLHRLHTVRAMPTAGEDVRDRARDRRLLRDEEDGGVGRVGLVRH